MTELKPTFYPAPGNSVPAASILAISMTSSPVPPQPVRGRILVVEAASVYREMQSLLLHRAGYEVVTAEQPQAALQLLDREEVDAVVLNNDGPMLESAEFVAALRRNHPSVSILFVAEALTLELTRDLSRLGVTTILQRPVNPQVLTQKIDEILGLTLEPSAPPFYAAAPTDTRQVQPHTAGAPTSATDGANMRSLPGATQGSATPFALWASTPPFTTNQTSRSPFSSYSTSACGSVSASPFPGFPYR